MEPLIRIELSEEGEMRTHVAASATNGISSAAPSASRSPLQVFGSLSYWLPCVNRSGSRFCTNPPCTNRLYQIGKAIGQVIITQGRGILYQRPTSIS